MALSEFGLGATWEDEEEKRRKQQALQANLRGGPQGLRGAARKANVDFAAEPTRYFDEQVAKVQHQRDEKANSPLQDYFKLANRYGGQEVLAQRIKRIADMWETYMDPYDGKQAIWELVRSPYTEGQIDEMMKVGQTVGFNFTNPGPGGLMVPESYVKELGYDANDPHQLKVAAVDFSMRGRSRPLSRVGGVSGWSKLWAGFGIMGKIVQFTNPATQGAEILKTAGGAAYRGFVGQKGDIAQKTLGGVGAALVETSEVSSGMKFAEDSLNLVRQTRGDKTIGDMPPIIPSDLHQQVSQYKAYLVESATETEIKDVEEWLNSPIYDVYGNLVEPAAAGEAEIDGNLSFDELRAIDTRYFGAERARRLAFMELQENNYITSTAEFNDNPLDPVFLEGMARAQTDFAMQMEAGRDHPLLSIALEQSGLPINSLRLGKLYRNLTSEGLVGLPFQGMKFAAQSAGSVMDFLPAALLTELRAAKDPIYQAHLDKLRAVVEDDMTKRGAGLGYQLVAGQNFAGFADDYIQRHMSDNENAMALRERTNVELQRVVHRWGFSGDIATIGYYLVSPMSGRSQKEIENIAAENYNFIKGFNVAFWLGLGKVGEAKPVARTAEALRAEPRATRTIETAADYIAGKDIPAARLQDLPLVEQLADAAMKGDKSSLQSVFGGRKISQTIADDLIKVAADQQGRIVKKAGVKNSIGRLEKAGFTAAEAEAMLLRGENIVQAIERNLEARGVVKETAPNSVNKWKRDRTKAVGKSTLRRKKGETLDQAADRFTQDWEQYVGKHDKSDALRTVRMSVAEQLSNALLAGKRYGEVGTAVHMIGGRDAPALARHLRNMTEGKGGTFSSVTSDSFVAVRKGLDVRLKAVLKYASDDAIKAIKEYRVVVKDGAGVRELLPTQKQFDRFVRHRQRIYGDVVDLRRYAHDEIGKWWEGAERGQARDIFPWLEQPLAPDPSFLRQRIHDTVAAIPDSRLRTYVDRWNHSFSEAPLSEVAWNSPRYAEHVFNMAYAATENVSMAKAMMDRAVMARTKADYQAIGTHLDALSAKHYVKSTNLYARDIAMSVDPRTGKPLGEFEVKVGGKTEVRRSVPETTMKQYTTSYAKTDMWARRQLDDGGIWRVADEVANLERQFAHSMHGPSGFMRNWTVASGFKLPAKHGLGDTTRTGVELGASALVEAGRTHGRLVEILDSMPREIQDSMAITKKRVESTEAHYLHDFHQTKEYHSAPIQKNRTKSARALRRIATSDVYRAWAKGWEQGGATKAVEAVRVWLESKEGVAFLREEGHYKTVRLMEKEQGRIVKGKALKDLAVQVFIDTHVLPRYAELEIMAPGIARSIREMVNKGEMVDVGRVRKILKENKDENPYMPVEQASSVGVNVRGALNWWTGNVLMVTNRLNRRVAFETMFVRTFDKLTKEGVAPEQAARIAETSAELGTQRIHFDLSRSLVVEQRHRWFAWFLTKHRLYSTWLVDIAKRYPGVAVAAKNVDDWITETFSDEDTKPWNKGKINFEFRGRTHALNLSAMLWLEEYGQESDVGQFAKEAGAKLLNAMPFGPDITVRQSPFGYTGIPRVVPTIKALNHYINLRGIFDNERLDTPEAQEEAIRDYLDSMNKDERDRWSKGLTIQQSFALRSGEGPISLAEATRRATWANLATTLWQQGSPVSMSIKGVEETAFDQAMERLYKEQDPVKRDEMLRSDPALIYGLNLTRDPVEALQINEGRREYIKAKEEMFRAYEAAWDDGSIDDPEVLSAILNNYEMRTSRMLNETDTAHYNAGYARYIASTGQKMTLGELKAMFPLTDMSTLEQDMFRPTGPEVRDKEKELTAAFDEEVRDRNWTDRDKDSLEYRKLKIDMVDRPLAEYAKEDLEPDLTRAESWAARYLARGKDAMFRRDQFMDSIEDQNKLNLWMKGLDSGDPTKTELLMASLTGEEKEYLGVNVKAETEARWDVIRGMLRDVHEESLRSGTSTSSKVYAAMKSAIDEQAAVFAQQDEQFAQEYYFSLLPLHERLIYIGVGDGPTKAEKGMAEFLSIVDDYYEELDVTPIEVKGKPTKRLGVGPTAGSSFDMTQPYLKRIDNLRKNNEEWWRIFNRRFTLGSFGFSWMAEDSSDVDIWRQPAANEGGE